MPNLPRDLPWAGCPKPELVAAYVDGMLDAGDRARMAGHLADCNDCSTVFAEAIRMQRAAAGRQNWMMVPTDRRSLLKLAGSLGVAAAVCLAVWPARNALSTAPSSNHPELAQLVEAVGSRRTIEPRLTGGFAYGTLPTVDPKRSGESASVELPLELRAAAIALEKRAQGASDPLALGAFGSAQLATGFSEKAVATFEEAARLLPKDARLLSDAAAAYLVRSRDKNQIEDVARAVGFAQQAVEAAPSLAEARFNLALSLEGLSLRGEASKAWNAYLEVDPASPWADEAKRRIERLAETPEARWEKQRRVVITASDSGGEEAIRAATQQFPDTAYEFVENDLVPGWADAWLARDEPKARELARRARLFGQALADGVGERMALDVAVSIERAQASKPWADVLARGHQLFREARALYDQDRVSASTELFRKADSDLRRVQSPITDWTMLHVAIDTYYAGNLSEAAKQVEPLLSSTVSNGHSIVAGRALRLRGLIHHQNGELGDSLDRYSEALAAFEKVGAREDVGAIHASIAENLEVVGDARRAWGHHGLALAELGATFTPRKRQLVLLLLANIARRTGFLAATFSLQNELILDAERSRRPGAAVEAYLGRAEVRQLQGDDRGALADIQEAAARVSTIPDQSLATRHSAETNLRLGEVLGNTNPLKARDAVNASLEFFRVAGLENRFARAYLAAGRASIQAGDLGSAEGSFLKGIQSLERQRARLPDGQLRWAYLGQPWNLFDEMIELQARQPHKLRDALRVAERARARDLLESATNGKSFPLVDPASLAKLLLPNTVVLYYASLKSQLLVWVIRSQGIELFKRELPSEELTRLVSNYHGSVSAAQHDKARRESEGLFDELIRPVDKILPAQARLIIVPDGPLHAVPFAALRNSATQRYLVEDHAVVMTPSATMFVRASSRLQEFSGEATPRVLIVANPLLDEDQAGSLPPLTAAETEGRDIAAMYRSAVTLTGPGATKQAFLEQAGRFGIVHFAGHAVSNDVYPLLSRLLLARSEDGRSGSLFTHEIFKLRPVHTRMVVLAACRTGMGPISKGEGALSLARPFLASNVPSVVATLWDVSDRASHAFFSAFYRDLRRGSEPVAALRAAQLALVNGDDPSLHSPASWAGYVALGGVTLSGGEQ